MCGFLSTYSYTSHEVFDNDLILQLFQFGEILDANDLSDVLVLFLFFVVVALVGFVGDAKNAYTQTSHKISTISYRPDKVVSDCRNSFSFSRKIHRNPIL